MAYHHPEGITIKIVGTTASDRGRSCKEHDVCGAVLDFDTVVRIRKVQVLIDEKEETALACYWVSEGIDRCRVGFLKRHLLKHWKRYDGKLAQVIELFKDSESPTKKRENHRNHGVVEAVVIDSVRHDEPPSKRLRTSQDDTEADSGGTKATEGNNNT